ncbi:MAG TPA: hypothetical protein VKV02_00595, partial [Acidobacteriaceae bacterium]|nr:hypothetical protein [Acidobacteriaceae bacterium]
MMSLRRIFGLMLLFLLFEAVVAVSTVIWGHDANVLLVCAAMTGIALAVWLTIYLVIRLVNKQRSAPPMDAPRPAAVVKKGDELEDSFTQEFKALLREANARLAGLMPAQPNGKPATLQSLPLYLVIGPEGSGKTSALLHSGLEPKLLAGEASRDTGVLPTKLANLWLSEGSLFVEISGRILIQDPDHWMQALRLLTDRVHVPYWKALLSGRPQARRVRGVLLACDTQVFLRQNDLGRLPTLARVLNERLQAVESFLQKDFP